MGIIQIFRKRQTAMLLWLTVIILTACGSGSGDPGFELDAFDPLSNYSPGSGLPRAISLEFPDVSSGFVIPEKSQTENGRFRLSFSIRNTGQEDAAFYFRVYYQNESYKFPEKDGRRQHALAHENFYGSWEQTATSFVKTPVIPADGKWHSVTADYLIQGNPRDEARYFRGDTNQRWKRNPRTGLYEFLLVVMNEEAIRKLPDGVRQLGPDETGRFVNPFYFFRYGKGNRMKGCQVMHLPSALKVTARLPFTRGIYADPSDFGDISKGYTSTYCGSDSVRQAYAAIRHFIHYVDESSGFNNIPVKADAGTADYSLTEYNLNRAFTSPGKRIRVKPETASCPCENTGVDSSGAYVYITNRAGRGNQMRKQSAGMITRHGFSYGTYTVKVDFPEMLGPDGLWNGLTYAVWLITQSDESWNNRRPCKSGGYLPRYWGGRDENRDPLTAYSEIDFEILKTASWCPEGSAPPALYTIIPDRRNRNSWDVPLPDEEKDQVMVSCTNWDMACPEPGKFGVGCHPVIHGDKTFYAHRWDHSYRAVTQKYPASDDLLFGREPYYFQIEWKPDEILWRIGPSPANMRLVGYMNSSMTSIPGNQMLLIVSQEFHSTQWWPGSYFRQEDIPFPLHDITGKILEITIE